MDATRPDRLGRFFAADWLPAGKTADRAFAAVVVLSLLVRFVVLAILGNSAFLISDEWDYVEAARVMGSGQHYIPYWSPGLPLYLIPFVSAGASNVVLRASMLLFWAFLCWGIWRLCQTLGIRRLAWLILLIFAVFPDSIQLSVEVQTEQVVAALLLLAVSAAIRCVKGVGFGEFALLGVASGCMALVRPSAMPLVFLLPFVCVVSLRGVAWPKRLAGPVFSGLLGGALIFSWMMQAHKLSGAWIVNTSNAVNLYYGNNPWTPMYRTWYFGSHAKLDDPEILNFPEYRVILQQAEALPGGYTGLAANHFFQKLATEEIEYHPGRFLIRDVNRVRCYFGFDTFASANLNNMGAVAHRLVPVSLLLEAVLYLCIGAPMFFFLASAPSSFWHQSETWLLGGASLIYAAPYWMSKSHPTYHYPILALMAMLAAIAWKTTRAEGGRWTRGFVALAVLGLIQVEWVWQLVLSRRDG